MSGRRPMCSRWAPCSPTPLLIDYRRLLGPEHPDTLETEGQFAWWRGTSGDPAGAVTTLEHLLAVYQRVLPDHPKTGATRDDLAHWRDKASGSTTTMDTG
jgi:hypothetical protein